MITDPSFKASRTKVLHAATGGTLPPMLGSIIFQVRVEIVGFQVYILISGSGVAFCRLCTFSNVSPFILLVKLNNTIFKKGRRKKSGVEINSEKT